MDAKINAYDRVLAARANDRNMGGYYLSRMIDDFVELHGDRRFGDDGATLVLNANHPLVQYILENKEDENTAMICEQLYDLGMLQNAPLSPEAMTKFVARSNDIMMLLTK